MSTIKIFFDSSEEVSPFTRDMYELSGDDGSESISSDMFAYVQTRGWTEEEVSEILGLVVREVADFLISKRCALEDERDDLMETFYIYPRKMDGSPVNCSYFAFHPTVLKCLTGGHINTIGYDSSFSGDDDKIDDALEDECPKIGQLMIAKGTGGFRPMYIEPLNVRTAKINEGEIPNQLFGIVDASFSLTAVKRIVSMYMSQCSTSTVEEGRRPKYPIVDITERGNSAHILVTFDPDPDDAAVAWIVRKVILLD